MAIVRFPYMLRIIAAFVIAPGTYPLGSMLYALLSGSEWAVSGGLGAAIVTYPTALIIGVPAYLFYRAWDLRSWWHYALGGGAIGSAVGAVYFSMGLNPNPMTLGASCFAIGAVSAFLFWLVGVWKSNYALESGASRPGTGAPPSGGAPAPQR